MASDTYNLDIGSSYNLALYASAVLGSGYSSAMLAAKLDYKTAAKQADVTGLHAKVLSQLPVGTPVSAASLLYMKFITTAGAEVILAQNWIQPTPVLVNQTTCTIVVSSITTADLAVLSAALHANGFHNFSISQP